MPQWFASPLFWIAIAFFFMSGIAIGVSVWNFQRARVAPYYFMREVAQRGGVRWLLVAAIALIFGGSTFYIRSHWPVGSFPPPTATMPLEPVPSPTATLYPSPTAVRTPSPAPTPLPTDTPLPSPTPTPAYPLPETALSPLPGAVPARPEARITLETFALEEENGNPVQPGSEFVAGDFRVYAFIRYEEMNRGAVWTYGWYQEGEYLGGNTCLWWVRRPDCPYIVGEQGRSFLYYRRLGGYDPGTYELRIWIEDRFQGAFSFVIKPAQQ